MVMNDASQVQDYHRESLAGGSMDSIHLFHLCKMAKIFRPNDEVLDLGCGTGDLLIKAASIFRETNFTGVDLSSEMLKKARASSLKLNLKNIKFVEKDITALSNFAESSFDVITSTMALHHLPSPQDLSKLGQSIARVLKKSGGLYVCDFLRLNSLKSVELMIQADPNLPAFFREDYRNSLLAAFSIQDYQDFLLPFEFQKEMVFISTHALNFFFYNTNRKPRVPFWKRKRIYHLPWNMLRLRPVTEFCLLRLFASKRNW